jgi:hypothetical protein
MKYLLVVVAVVLVFLAGSCTQRTCPTYTKGLKEVPQEQQDEIKDQKERV